VDDLRALDLDTMTPIEALNRLAELQKKAAGIQADTSRRSS
jgi:hypothetical protein